MNFLKLISALWLTLASASVSAQSLLNISFGNDSFEKHLESLVEGVALGKSPEHQSCLVLSDEVKSQSLKAIKVQPLQKYKLTLRAAIDAVDTVETNDRLPEFSPLTWGRTFAGCDLYFSDKDGNSVTFRLYGRGGSNGTKKVVAERLDVITREAHDYVIVFYAPPMAETLHISLAPQKRTLLVEKVILEVEDNEATVNCNPDFRYGELNPSGWKQDREGRLFQRLDHTTVLKSGMNATGPVFVVDDKSRYSFLCKGVDYDKSAGKVTVSFFDETGKELGYTHLFWGADMKDCATKAGIRPLPGSQLAMIKASRVILEKVMVSKD